MKKNNLLILTFLLASTLNGCNTNAKITGTEAAKLLLADERLDENNLKVTNIFSASDDKLDNITNTNSEVVKRTRNYARKQEAYDTGATFSKDGNTFIWKNFGDYSNSVTYFENFISNIEQSIEYGSKTIDTFKNEIESNNVWVKTFSDENLLQVNANQDVIMSRDETQYNILTRSKNEYGVEYYEFFDGILGQNVGSRVKKLGDYRYEYSLNDKDASFKHIFIADKSRGYWIIYSPLDENNMSVNVIKDDKCYEFTINVEEDGQIPLFKVMTGDSNCDIATISSGSFEFYLGAFNNISSASIDATTDQIGAIENSDENDIIYDAEGQYSMTGSKLGNITLQNGTILKPEQTFANGKVQILGSLVGLLADGYYGTLQVIVEGETFDEKLKNIRTFINESGLSFKTGLDSTIQAMKDSYNDAFASNFALSWNDINIDSASNFAKAYEIEDNKLENYKEMYKKVSNNTVLSKNAQGKLDRGTSFPYIINSSFDAEFKNNVVSINTATVKVDDFVLFDIGEKYNMQYALAKYDDENEGYYDLVHITTNNPDYVTYNGEEELILSTDKLNFTLPAPSNGTYELVTYIANSQGIRVTRPLPIKFNNVENSEISIHNFTVNASKNDENHLALESVLNNNVVLVIENAKNTYSYNELYSLLSTEAFTYGVISNKNIEMLDSTNNWISLNGTEASLSSGTYRLAFTNKDNESVYVSTSY